MLLSVVVSWETHQLSFVSVWKAPQNASDYPQTRRFVPIKRGSYSLRKDIPTPSLCEACGRVLCVCTNCVRHCAVCYCGHPRVPKKPSPPSTRRWLFVRTNISWNDKGRSNSMSFQGNCTWATLPSPLISHELESINVSLVLWNSPLEKILHSHRVWVGQETNFSSPKIFLFIMQWFNKAYLLTESWIYWILNWLLIFMWNHSLHGHFVGS